MRDPAYGERTRPIEGRHSANETKLCPQCGRRFPSAYKVCPHDRSMLLGSDDEPSGDPLIGEVLSSAFCITGVIGEGGMGRVYDAEHVRLPRRYAVKVIAPHLARHAEAVGRFEREAQAAARIIHPNVLDVVDVVRAKDGRPCIVSELLEGEELGDQLDKGWRPTIAEAVDIARQACRGLSAAHAQNIVHRDLKPANLFLSRRADGERVVKVLDFGVAKMGDGASLTKTGTVVGTPSYMAPEQARGLPTVDGRADIYSLGAVLYGVLTGSPPFDHDDPASILMAVVNELPTPIRQLAPSVPVALEHIVETAMKKDPAERYPTAAAFEAALAAFAKELEPSVARVSAPSAIPAHSPTLVDPAPQRMTLPGAPPPDPVMGVIVAAALVGVGVVAMVGVILVLVSSKRALGDSTALLATLFVAILATAGLAFVATLRQRR